ncbi:hypothetical protein [Nostoc favosum]|uniref:Tetratricopeptide repeat protein n=1 Tax=Nostoc favosum CHAB5714 TaxID=2780399 RepID=A0ABS8IEH7_9NOSO|nr:hypothetical protein [Nostoc favosum]MCC5602460.1 hypothetical protein [Nostoc favosum CHAB5714]
MSSSKKDFTNLAKQKLDSGDFQEALDIYYQVYIDFSNEWNSWDTVFLLKCLRNNAG